MKAPKYIAIVVCLLLAFIFLQGLTWPIRSHPDWQQSWWQFHALASVGHILLIPAWIPVLVLENLGIFNSALLIFATALGLLLEIMFVFLATYFIASRWLELHSDD